MSDSLQSPQSSIHTPDISVIIVNWRSKDFVRKCIQSIRDHGRDVRTEIIVVDGASFDGCDEMLAREFPEARFVQAFENRGFGYANNLGAKEARGHYLLLLNPDTELHPGALQRLVATHRAHSRYGLIGPRLLNTDGTLQKSCVQAFPTPLNQALGSELLLKLLPRSRLWGSARAFSSDQPTPVDAISGACMLIERSLYKHLNGFDERYFMYAEDMDLCKRVSRYGLQVVHEATAVVTHHGGQSSKTQLNAFSTLHMRKALSQYMRIHYGWWAVCGYKIGQSLSALLRIFLLVAQCALAREGRRQAAYASLTKWGLILRWSLGLRAAPDVTWEIPPSLSQTKKKQAPQTR